MRHLPLSILVLFAVAACSSDNAGDKCKDNCRIACEGEQAPTGPALINCDTECDAIQARVEKRGCDGDLAALYDCAEQNQCKATFAADCRVQTDDLAACELAYCRANTSDPDC